MYHHNTDFLQTNGYLITDIPAFPPTDLEHTLRAFMDSDPTRRQCYLQKHFGYAFDGYSYAGQVDSTNQAEDDLVSTFVFSNFYPIERYPAEFQSFLNAGWHQIRPIIQALEIKLITGLDVMGLGLTGLLDFYQQHIGHMVSCNYYPPMQHFATSAADNTRLSAHPDVSLFTVFPFGIDGELEMEIPDASGQVMWQSVSATDMMVIFPGYLMERWSGGALKALNHRVKVARDVTLERFSFAFFSLPFPNRRFILPSGSEMTSELYFEDYLNLF